MADTTDLSALEGALLAEIKTAADAAELERVRIAAFGKKGRVSELMAGLGAMPADLVHMAKAGIVEHFIGAPLDDARELYVSASPLSRISARSAPMFLYHGTWDWLVSADNSRRMYAGLHALGVPCELYLQHGTGHFTTFLYDRGPLRAAIAFLDAQVGGPDAAQVADRH